jgi:hypothetical protein
MCLEAAANLNARTAGLSASLCTTHLPCYASLPPSSSPLPLPLVPSPTYPFPSSLFSLPRLPPPPCPCPLRTALLGTTSGEAYEWSNNGLNYLMLGLEALVFFLLVLLVDSGACSRRGGAVATHRDAIDRRFDAFARQRGLPVLVGGGDSSGSSSAVVAAALEAAALEASGGDDDVVAEAQRIARGERRSDDIILMDKLRKVYPGRKVFVWYVYFLG